MFFLTSKKYEFYSPYNLKEFKEKFNSDIRDYSYKQLRKDSHRMDIYYGKLKGNEIHLHYHQMGKRDLDNPYYKAVLTEKYNGTFVKGRFCRKLKDSILAWSITVILILLSVFGFVYQAGVGILFLVITIFALYIFFWDKDNSKRILYYLEKFK